MTPSIARWSATVLGVGFAPKAPGTFGSLAALPLIYVLHVIGGFALLAAATVLITFLGIWASGVYERDTGRDDPGEVVIDEVAGQMIALWPLSAALPLMTENPWLFPWPGWVGGFVLFRLFDILKPPPVSWAERLPGGWGVMMDDVVAGILAAIVAGFGAFMAHVVLV